MLLIIQVVKKSVGFVEPKGSLACFQKPAIKPCSD
jgi:hypothetical protein